MDYQKSKLRFNQMHFCGVFDLFPTEKMLIKCVFRVEPKMYNSISELKLLVEKIIMYLC